MPKQNSDLYEIILNFFEQILKENFFSEGRGTGFKSKKKFSK